jgi:hypothetical protein
MSFLRDIGTADAVFSRFDYIFFTITVLLILFFWNRIIKFLSLCFWYSCRVFVALFFSLIIQGALFFTPPYQIFRKVVSGVFDANVRDRAAADGGDEL